MGCTLISRRSEINCVCPGLQKVRKKAVFVAPHKCRAIVARSVILCCTGFVAQESMTALEGRRCYCCIETRTEVRGEEGRGPVLLVGFLPAKNVWSKGSHYPPIIIKTQKVFVYVIKMNRFMNNHIILILLQCSYSVIMAFVLEY